MNMETFGKKNERYELQFASADEVRVQDVTIPVYRLSPEKPANDTYTFFAPAFGQKVEEMYKDVGLKTLYEKEKMNLLTFDPPAEGAEFEITPEEHARIDEFEFPHEEIQMAKRLISVIDTLKTEGKIPDKKIDVIAHSRGMGYSTIAALLRPDLFSALVGYGGVGLIGKDNLARLLYGSFMQGFTTVDWGAEPTDMDQLSRDIAHERKTEGKNRWVSMFVRPSKEEVEAVKKELHDKKASAAQRGIEEYAAPTDDEKAIMDHVGGKSFGVTINYLRENLFGRRLQELRGMANIRIDRALVKIAKERGIGVGLAHGDNDPMFPKEKYEEIVLNPELRNAGIILHSLGATHGTAGERPIVMRQMAGLLQLVKNENSKRNASLMGRIDRLEQ